MAAQYGQPTLTDPSTDKLHSDFIPESVTQNGIYKVIAVQTSDLSSSDVTIATLAAPTGKTVMIPTSYAITVVSKAGSVTVAPIINIGKASALYDDMISGVTIPTGLLDTTRAALSGVLGVYQNGDVIKMHKTTAITGGSLTIQIDIFGYWL